MSEPKEYERAEASAFFAEHNELHQRVMFWPFVIAVVIVALTVYGMLACKHQLKYADVLTDGQTVTAEVEELGVRGGKIARLLARCNLSLQRFGEPYTLRVNYGFGDKEYSETRYLTRQARDILDAAVDEAEDIPLLVDPDDPGRFTTAALIGHYQQRRVLKTVVNIVVLIVFGYVAINNLFVFWWRGWMVRHSMD